MSTPLILASASPRRAELLRSAGIAFVVRAVDVDESWLAGETPLAYVERVAVAKARAAGQLDGLPPGALILAADTTVWLRDDVEPLAKPRDADHAAQMLRALTRGQPHWVSTACAFCWPATGRVQTLIETTTVHMRELSPAQFDAFIGPYLARASWADKAGAYAIQADAAALVERIEGSYTTVVGLPLAQVVAALDELREEPRP